MKKLLVTSNGITTVTNNISNSQIPTPVLKFNRAIVRSTFNYEEIKGLVDKNGGYIITKNGAEMDEYSIGDVTRYCDYYFADDFMAVVYRSDITSSRIIRHSDFKYDSKFHNALNLLPDAYCSTAINRLMKAPPQDFTFIGDRFFQHIDGVAPLGLEAQYEVWSLDVLTALFNIKGSSIPWLHYPLNEAAAQGVAEVLNNHYYDARSQGLSLDFAFEDLDGKGIVLHTASKKARKNAARVIAEAKTFEESGLDFSVWYPTPATSNENNPVVIQVCTKTLSADQEEVVLDGLFLGADYKSTFAASVETALSDNLDKLPKFSAFLIDSELNEDLKQASLCGERARRGVWVSKYNQLCDGVNDFIDDCGKLIPVVINDAMTDLIKTSYDQIIKKDWGGELEKKWDIQSHLSVDTTQLNAKIVKPTTKFNRIGEDEESATTTEIVRARVDSLLDLYGCDVTVDSMSVKFGDEAKKRVRTQVQAAYTTVMAKVQARLLAIADTLEKGKIVSSDKNTNRYGLFGRKKQKFNTLRDLHSTWLSGTMIEAVNVYAVNGIVKTVVTFRTEAAKKIYKDDSNFDWKHENLFKVIEEQTGITPESLGYVSGLHDDGSRVYGKVWTERKWRWGRDLKYDNRSYDYEWAPVLRWRVTFEDLAPVSNPVDFSSAFFCSKKNLVLDTIEKLGDKAYIDAFCAYLGPRLEKYHEAMFEISICVHKQTADLLSLGQAKCFAECSLLENELITEALKTLDKNLIPKDNITYKTLSLIDQLTKESKDFVKEPWIDPTVALPATGQFDIEAVPLYLFVTPFKY